ncbi:MAG: hypothetical protein IH965_05670 [Gemmatimonadetes bacterium]|nr:hypothetical protein [Gemmatimonadota bacterium]
MRNPVLVLLAAAGSLVLWVVLTFLMDLRSGWTHLPLAVAVVLIVIGIVESDERRGRNR